MVGMITDVGNVRNLNEDFLGYFEDENMGIYVIADGMGGHNAGEIASKMAVESIIEYLKEHYNNENPEKHFREAIIYANEKILDLSEKYDKLNGMGTTITACFSSANKILIANVGDSSCFVIGKSFGIMKVTKDHSLVQQLIDEGSITENEALSHPNKNIITRAVGTGKKLEVDIYDISDKKFDKVVLCTDGLTNEIRKEELYEIIINNEFDNLNELCKCLVEKAKSRGGRDNISLMIFGGEHYDDRNNIRR